MAFRVHTIFIVHKKLSGFIHCVAFLRGRFPSSYTQKTRHSRSRMLCSMMEWELKLQKFYHIKQILKQNHFLIITLCKIFVPIFCYCVNILILLCSFFYLDLTIEQRTAQIFLFGLYCTTCLSVSSIIILHYMILPFKVANGNFKNHNQNVCLY